VYVKSGNFSSFMTHNVFFADQLYLAMKFSTLNGLQVHYTSYSQYKYSIPVRNDVLCDSRLWSTTCPVFAGLIIAQGECIYVAIHIFVHNQEHIAIYG